MKFTTDFKHTLAINLKKKFGSEYTNVSPEETFYAKGEYKICFDIYLESRENIVVIELEVKRQDPVHNVIKTIYWLQSVNNNKKVYMIQLFNDDYYKEKKMILRKSSEFIGKRVFMLSRRIPYFNYSSISFHYPGGGKNPERKLKSALDELLPRLVKRIRAIGK